MSRCYSTNTSFLTMTLCFRLLGTISLARWLVDCSRCRKDVWVGVGVRVRVALSGCVSKCPFLGGPTISCHLVVKAFAWSLASACVCGCVSMSGFVLSVFYFFSLLFDVIWL